MVGLVYPLGLPASEFMPELLDELEDACMPLPLFDVWLFDGLVVPGLNSTLPPLVSKPPTVGLEAAELHELPGMLFGMASGIRGVARGECRCGETPRAAT